MHFYLNLMENTFYIPYIYSIENEEAFCENKVAWKYASSIFILHIIAKRESDAIKFRLKTISIPMIEKYDPILTKVRGENRK